MSAEIWWNMIEWVAIFVRNLLGEPFPRVQLFTEEHLQRLEEEHDSVRGDDSEAVADVGDDDQGDTHACEGDKDKQPGDRIKQTRW